MAVTPSGLHSITVGLHEGMLTLAALSIAIIVAAKLYGRIFGKNLYVDVDRIVDYVEPATILGALGGVASLLASMYIASTLLIGGAGSIVDSPLLMNKTMMSLFALELWVIFIIIRAVHGRKIWDQRFLSAVYAAIGIAGFLFTMEAGSLGGHLAGKGSVLDPIYELIEIQPDKFFVLGNLGTYAMLGTILVAGLLTGYFIGRRRR